MSNTLPTSPADQRESGSRATELRESARHELLANRRRRLAVELLDGRVDSIDLADVATEIAAREETDPTPDAVERAAIELHHNHLPKLDEYGLIEYEPKARLVHATGETLATSDATNVDTS